MTLDIGIDVGGTKVLAGVVDSQGKIIEKVRRETPIEGGKSLTKIIAEMANELKEKHEVTGIGVCSAGFFAPNRRKIIANPNIANWNGVELADELEDLIERPVVLENDANAAAWAEALMGAGVNEPNFLYATLGTGIGGGVILNGRLYRGPHGDAGEIGHIIMDAWAREGAKDPRLFRTAVLEDYVGIQGILQMARDQGEVVRSVRDITNDHVLREAGRIIGIGMCSALAVLGLRVLIIGGGVSQAPFILDTIRATMALRAIPTIAHNLRVLPAQFGSHAGLIGAAAVGRACVVS